MSNKHTWWAWAAKNSVCIVCWTWLAIWFNHWWIALFALFFMTSLESKNLDADSIDNDTLRRFGVIPGVTDRNYITNSYHVHVSEPINAFDKLKFESEFQALSPGGAISYVEVPNMQNNIPAGRVGK